MTFYYHMYGSNMGKLLVTNATGETADGVERVKNKRLIVFKKSVSLNTKDR